MDREKVTQIMNEAAERIERECKNGHNNAGEVLALAKALNELVAVYEGLVAGKGKKNRYAFEWLMRAEDERYWKMAKGRIKKITVLAGAGTVISGISILLLLVHMFL